ncbi:MULTISPECIES: SDR family NAD(P)-dependent oxidoreductase [unclassified Solwaraspora]|uniref:SDR family NAD(P)-dependent oxidoreductase n=1 Tax=unclassified Solwaraspora TaxID=2627926 RepID=UPI00259B6A5D|nr:SDR family oxidoreductase [Solwaraspora sp. WMMA2056]WJK38711.1 SDR family oxidoreductase [Solwaraspora sp. WMMA2056]
MTIHTVLVTGGANGIGRALVQHCLTAGMTVLAADIDDLALKHLAEEHHGRALEVYHCDVGSRADCDRLMDQVFARHPKINGLVNNAGMYLGQPVWDYDDTTMDKVIEVNLKGPIWLSRRLGERLLATRRDGAIVNLASVAGEVGSSDALYGTVKAGVIGLTKSNAMNFAPHVRVNAVAPGLVVNTAIADRIPQYRYDEYKRQERLTGDITPADVADVCAYLLSDRARTLTGALIPADNGCYPR